MQETTKATHDEVIKVDALSTPDSKSNELHFKAEVDETLKLLAEKRKNEGNEFFKKDHFQQAIQCYSEAIDVCPAFTYYSNRANAYQKLEIYGSAILDSLEAISLEPLNAKGHYRLAQNYFLLAKYKDAQKSFLEAYKLKPSKLFKELYEKAKAESKRVAFEEAIALDQPGFLVHTFDLTTASLSLPASYEGPQLYFKESKSSRTGNIDDEFKNGVDVDGYEVTPEFASELSQWMFEQQLPHKKVVAILLIKIFKLLSKLPTLLEIDFIKASLDSPDVKFNVCGDTHGQFYDLRNIFDLAGEPSEKNHYLFNGDFVDRGSFSCEVILTLFAYKLAFPNYFHLLRGNHETRNMNRIYGFDGEVEHKFDSKILQLFSEVFRVLPLAATLNSKIIIMHGGLPSADNVSLQDIKKLKRNCEPAEEGLMNDLLWSDPQPFPGRSPSKRGVGTSFGPDVTKKFLEFNNLDMVIRSHEVRDEGYLVEHEGKLITVFSAPNYCDQMGNKGAVIVFKKDLKPSFIQFEAVPHPDIRPMAYAANMSMFA